jgi:hypothetical protein
MAPKSSRHPPGSLPPHPLTFQDLPQDLRRTILFQACIPASDENSEENENEEKTILPSHLARLTRVRTQIPSG